MEQEQEINNELIRFHDGLVLNKKYIRWIKKVHDCMYICTKSDGCNNLSSHVICSSNEEHKKDFERLNVMFR